MKYIQSLLLIAIMSWLHAANAANSPFNGTWAATIKCSPEADNACTPEKFSLRLAVSHPKVCGLHSVVAQGGNKIDAFGDPEKSIIGKIEVSTVKVTFDSSFGGKGQAELSIREKRLYWRITQDDGMHYLPQRAVLKRVPSTKWGSKLSCD